MSLTHSPDQVLIRVANLLFASPGFQLIQVASDRVRLESKDFKYDWTISPERMAAIGKSLQAMDFEETALIGDRYYEVLVRPESPRVLVPMQRIIDEQSETVDSSLGLQYRLSKCSDEYLIALLDKLSDDNLRDLSRDFYRYVSWRVESGAPMSGLDLIDVLKELLPRIYTLQIRSSHYRSKDFLRDIATAFLFTLAYNLDLAIVPVRLLDEFVGAQRLRRLRRLRLQEIEPPKRRYVEDLVYYYQLALATDSAALKYLSFYHILEFFFEEVYREELLASIRNHLTQPGFSPARPKDLQDIVSLVEKHLKRRGQEVNYNEQDALMYTLHRYVDRDQVVAQLYEFDSTLPDYYAQNVVAFSGGPPVQLEEPDLEKVYRALAARIYRTRNAIVHSKQGRKPRYVPFEHDKYILKEIPLIRFIAESALVNSSEIISVRH